MQRMPWFATPTRRCWPILPGQRLFATAATFGGLPRVRFWQGMNEPNLNLFFRPQFSQGKAGFTRAVSDAAQQVLLRGEVCRSLKRGLGCRPRPVWNPPTDAFCPPASLHGREAPPASAREETAAAGSTSTSSTSTPTRPVGPPTGLRGPDVVQLGDLPKLQRLLEGRRQGRKDPAASTSHTPLWITEFAWASKPPDPGGLAMRDCRAVGLGGAISCLAGRRQPLLLVPLRDEAHRMAF